tara:strand:- start:402 stop:1124 length:723 start_codon:yes stop_codon:yes gene_type:complete
MYLAIDIGNTNTKFFLFSDEKLIEKGNFPSERKIKAIEEVCASYKIGAIIYSNVSNSQNDDLKRVFRNYLVYEVSNNLKLPFINEYKDVLNLGSDRIGLVCAAIKKYPNKDVLVIDLGTCITYDFISSTKIYQGGAITPGFMMRYKSLNLYTSKLPMLDFNIPKKYNGNSTFESIHSGIYFGIIDEIKGRIDFYKKRFKNLKVILTGGDSNKLPNSIKSGIFADSNFIGEGLLYLLKFNL